MARAFVTRPLPGPALDRLRESHDVDIWPGPLPPSYKQLASHAQRADGLLTLPSDRIDAALLEQAPALKAISNYAVGYDNVDVAAAAAHGIAVGHTPDVLTDATAELTFTLLLALARSLPDALAVARDGGWQTWEPARHLGVQLSGATLGIVGLGRIGKAVAKRAKAFGMKVISTSSANGAKERKALLSQADFVSLHAPLTEATRHLIDAGALSQMKPTAFLINTGRGGLVDQAALIEALADARIAGAALDVTDPEPPPRGDPLLSAPNLILTPHIGSATRTARERMAELAVENLLAALDGKPMPHPVPPPAAV